jgi:beta-galactosidase
MRERVWLDRDWLYRDSFSESDITNKMTDGMTVDLPHTVSNTPFHYFDEISYQKTSCYQHTIDMKPEWAGMRIILTFFGAAHRASVYLNGDEMTVHSCGYTAFSIDLTGRLKKDGSNLITVKLDSKENLNQPPFGYVIDYMTYGGLYRDVCIDITDKKAIEDIYAIAEPLDADTCGMTADEIRNLKVNGHIESVITLTKSAFKLLCKGKISIRQRLGSDVIFERKLEPGDVLSDLDLGSFVYGKRLERRISIDAPVNSIKLWDIESPNRYRLFTELLINDKVVDKYTQRIGFLKREFKSDGFRLNGRIVKIHGLNRHQSYPYIGYAANESIDRFDAKILKDELSVNAVRTSHYPDSQAFFDECDKRGLLVFTEMPGWQHIGDVNWKDQALLNEYEMITQYRNHPSIILWGVRINESKDDNEFYARTNALSHILDPFRQTGGVRADRADGHTIIQEDVMTYNDFSFDGTGRGCLPKRKVTNDMKKPYLITEYNGHMFPCRMYDDEIKRTEHAMRHAAVLDAVAGEKDITGSFGWCMFDYNTHKDFGSGDRICYHGVMDMFRNPKPAAYVYAAEGSSSDILYVTSTMDIGEHPKSSRGRIYIISNADSVRMYSGDDLLKEYHPSDSGFKNLKHGPVLVDDYIGDRLIKYENMGRRQSDLLKTVLNGWTIYEGNFNAAMLGAALQLMIFYRMKMSDIVGLYQKYIGNWGQAASIYRFEAVKDGKVVKTVIKGPVSAVRIDYDISSDSLKEKHTCDAALIRIRAVDEYGNVLPYYNEPLRIRLSGPISLAGPKTVSFQGGQTGIIVKSQGRSGKAEIRIGTGDAKPVRIKLNVEAD